MNARHHLERSQHVPRGREEVFAFFSDARNLSLLTPPYLRLEILTPSPITMRAGTRIEYTLRLFGLPMRWRTRIDAWRPGEAFVDVQEAGPYAFWRHTHRFEPTAEGTRIVDVVEYTLPFGFLGRMTRALLVGRVLEGIFDYRGAMIRERFGAAPAQPATAR